MGKIKYMRAKAHELRSKRTYTDKANTIRLIINNNTSKAGTPSQRCVRA